MLYFSFSTILMALLTSSLLVILVAFVFLHTKTLVCTGYRLLGIFVGLAIIRLFFPFEFPFTTTIPLSPLLSKIISFFRKPQIEILNATLSLWNLFEIVWIVGVIFHSIRYINQYRNARDYILKYGLNRTEDIKYKTILDNICLLQNKKNVFRVVELPNMSIPIIFGLKNPCIILPTGLSIPDDKLYYVFYHEAMHYFHHDFLVKSIIRFFSIIYWWNPAFNVLYKQTNTLLEMHIDGSITHKKTDITEKYAECLLYMKKNSIKYSSHPMSNFLKKESFFLVQSQDKDFKRRLLMLLQDFAIPRKICTSIILAFFIVGVYLTSYLFILEADNQPMRFVEESLYLPDEDNTYFIQNDAFHYEIYINGVYFDTVDSLEGYSNGIKIYNKKGELIHEN